MNTEIEELKEEILILKKRIEVLESNERKRKVLKIISFVIKALLYIGIVVAIWLLYDYFTTKLNSIPDLINNGINNIDLGKLDLFGIFK